MVAAGAVLALSACTVSPTDGSRALDAAGLHDGQIGGYAFFGCDQNDTFQSTFTATTASGHRVRGVVCSGWLKGVTVRITGDAPSAA